MVRGPWRVCLGAYHRMDGETILRFLQKIKPIKLRAVTANHSAFEFAPIAMTSEHLPEWFKSLPVYKSYAPFSMFGDKPADIQQHLPNMRGCVGFTDMMRQGVVLPMWNDVQLRVPEKKDIVGWVEQDSYKGVISADNKTKVEPHGYAQYNGAFPLDVWWHQKIASPWFFICEEEINFLWTDPLWLRPNTLEHYSLLPAVINYKWQHATNINMMLRKHEQEGAFYIPFNQPLAQVIPMSPRPLQLFVERISQEEEKKLVARLEPITFSRKYSVMKQVLKKKEK